MEMPEYRRHITTGRPIFVTVVTHRRRRWLASPANAQLLLDSMKRVKAFKPYRNHAHVILPDHFHWLMTPQPGVPIGSIVSAVKRHVTWRLKEAGSAPPFWQNRFLDHVIRNERDFGRHLDYIHYNPVRHDVATMPIAHDFSSFGEWVRRGVYARDWGADAAPEALRGMDLE